MGGLFTSFNAGVSGLKVSQAAINVASHNIANADTKGHVRQQAIITDSRYNNTMGYRYAYNQIGLGTDMACIRQVRDIFLDKNYRLEVGRESFYEVQYKAVTEVEDLFGELEGEPFQDVLKGLWDTLQELSKEPDSIVKRDLFVSAANSFIEKCGIIGRQLSEYQESLNTQINNEVKEINNISKQIYDLNLKIALYEAGGRENANDLRDTRNQLLDELGRYIRFNVTEQPNGMVTVYAEGAPLVSQDRYYTMKVEKISEDSNLLKPVWADNGCGDVFDTDDISFASMSNMDVGSLRSILVARGTGVANYTGIPIQPDKADYTDASGNFNEAAYKMAAYEFEEAKDLFNQTISPSVIMTLQAQFDQLVHTIVTLFNDTLCPNVELELEDGTKIWVLDEEKAPITCDGNETMGIELFSRKSMPRYTEVKVKLADGSEKTVMRYNEEDPSNRYSLYSVRELVVNPDVLQNSNLLPIMSNSTSGNTGGFIQDNIENLLGAFDIKFAALDPNTLTTYTFGDYYVAMIGSLATKGDCYKGIADNQAEMVRTIENRRQSLMGVSTDEEMTDLIRFQHAYNASSRYITAIDEMLEHLVTRL